MTDESVNLRPVRHRDADRILRWRNHPFIAERGASRTYVDPQDHLRWFDDVLGNPDERLFLILISDAPHGLLRLSRRGARQAVITVYLEEGATGRGRGTRAIRLGVSIAVALWAVEDVIAHVRQDNSLGRKAFSKTGFVEEADDSPAPKGCTVFRWRPELGRRASADVVEDDQANIRHFSAALRDHGGGHRAVDWGRHESQVKRFAVLADIGFFEGAHVLDVGCGLGELLFWCRQNGFDINYTGIDITPSMVTTASRRFPDARFFASSLHDLTATEAYDFVVASGLFTIRQNAPFAFLQDTIIKMFCLCRCAVAVNCLSDFIANPEPNEYREDPGRAFLFGCCLTDRVTLRHDYHPSDFTLYLYRSKAA